MGKLQAPNSKLQEKRKLRISQFWFAVFGIFLVFGIWFFGFSDPVFAQTVDPTEGLDTFAEQAGFTTTGDVRLIIARLIRTVISFLGIIAVVFILYGGFLYMTAGGAEDKIKRAKRVFTSAIIGLVIILSSFAITQFVLSRLTEALGGGVSGEGAGGGSSIYSDSSGTSDQFLVTSVNTDCAEALQNFQLQVTFSQRVDSSTFESGVTIQDADGGDVAGSWSVSGKRATFTPNALCDGYTDEYCWDAATEYELAIDSTVVESTSGDALECSDSYPCSYTFTTGSAVDISIPSVDMDAPENGESVYVGNIETLQSLAVDDTGVSSVDFTVDGEVVYQAALSTDSTEGNLATTNYFYTADGTEWDTAGYSTGSYSIRAEGADCAGNTDTSAAVTVVLRPAHCDNDTQDEDEEGEDCGGEDCGACDGESCDSDDDCASGYCDEESGECVGVPKIEEVSPGDGAGGNLVTVSGEGFGDTPDEIVFLGDETTNADDVTVSAYECNGAVQWSDDEIIVQLQSAMSDGPIQVSTADGFSDQTNDDYGPSISDFDMNGVVRPGICDVDPDSNVGNTDLDITGNNFGPDQGTATVYFSSYEASDYNAWADTLLSVVVPLLNAREYRTQVWVGDYACVNSDGSLLGTTCAEDADCDTADGQSCSTSFCSESAEACDDDDDCGEGEECVSRRQGSNKVDFTVVDASSGETPVISQVDSGWEACSDGTRCGEDDDCSSGTCDAADNWGPPGQYVTVYGSSFGSSTGTVRFSDGLGYAYADTEFPDACGDDFWSDDEITVKVPATYTNVDQDGDGEGDAIEPGTFTLSVITSSNAESDGVEFVLLDDEPGPGICDIDPASGPAGTTTVLSGDNFESSIGAGYVEFFDGQQVSSVTTWNNSAISVVVDADAATGPVFAVTDAGYESNSVNFEVGDCNEDATLCAEGTQCCADGSCSTACEEEIPVSHVAWMFSTGDIPSAPRILVQCDDSYISPSPWERWNDADEICLDSLITVAFSTTMADTSYEGNVTVYPCTGTGSDPCGTLGTAVSGSVTTSSNDRVLYWQPDESWEASTTYQATILSTVESVDGLNMSEDYVWEFTTAAATDLCEVDEAYVTPATATLTEEGDTQAYASSPVANRCVVLACSDSYEWEWSSSFSGAVLQDGTSGTSASYGCANTVEAVSETPTGSPAEITAEITNVTNTPSDSGELTINYTDPEVTSWEPSCETACVNARVSATFNTLMEDVFTGAPGDYITLYLCEDSLCDDDELTEVSSSAYNVDGTNTSDDPSADGVDLVEITHGGYPFEANSWYRVVIDGDAVSESGVALSESGSNYPSDDNNYFPDDFSWKFKTKDSDVPCEVDRVVVDPDAATATRIGQQHLWEAIPYGAPDDCSTSGQALDPSSYDWEDWDAADAVSGLGSSDDDVAAMFTSATLSLTSDLEEGCSSSCLNTGSAVGAGAAVCGDGATDYDGDGVNEAEDCDDYNDDDGDGCSSECLYEGNATACSSTVTSGCCGDSIADSYEECDDGGSADGDGCSSECLNEGSRAIGSSCGDSIVDQSASTGGEDCDDGNAANGDGCSSNCLFEGGEPSENVYSTCGNNSIEDGEDCDDGNYDDGDGCSAYCLYEGAEECAFECYDSSAGWTGENCSGIGATTCSVGSCLARVVPCCGDNRVDYSGVSGAWSDQAEDCDSGDAEDGDGCSAECLNEGSSTDYSTASYCGDGDPGTGEECEAASGASFDVDWWGVSLIQDEAAQDVIDGTAGSEITAEEVDSSATGTAELTLECSCTTDASCGDETSYGCGAANCCYSRPSRGDVYPADAASDVCLNTAVWVDFSEDMDEASLDLTEDSDGSGTVDEDEYDPQLYLVLTSLSGASVDATNCPEDYLDARLTLELAEAEPRSWVGRVWNWVVRSVRSLFGRSATAASYACLVPVSYSTTPNDDGGDRVYLQLADVLEADAEYTLVIIEDSDITDAVDEGVLSAAAVGVEGGSETFSFSTGSEICELEAVEVEDLGRDDRGDLVPASAGYFTESGEVHDIQATAYTVRGSDQEEIAEVTGVYEWSWGWGSSECDSESASCTAAEVEDNVVTVVSADAAVTTATAAGLTGRETVVATATISEACDSDSDCDSGSCGATTAGVCDDQAESGDLVVTANVCENPPAIGTNGLYLDSVSNFSFYYCRDAGDDATEDDDLPELSGPVDVVSYTSDIIQEVIFPVEGTSDAIGVRVLKNQNHCSETTTTSCNNDGDCPSGELCELDILPPDLWFEAQGFTGSPSETELDGYEAVQDGNTVYVAAANHVTSTSVPAAARLIYPNIYVVSYTEGAEEESQEIFDQVLDSWSFNANSDDVTDVNLCGSGGSYASDNGGNLISCEWDGDCVETCEDADESGSADTCSLSGNTCAVDTDCPLAAGAGYVCDAEKAQLTRDTERLTDTTRLVKLLADYGEENGYCSVTADQTCVDDSECPGDETCEPGTPKLQSGTFVSAMSVSAWPSWAAELGNALGEALPEDPLNEFYVCDDEGYESDTCWNATEATFVCPDESHVYGYTSTGGIAYRLFTQLEYDAALWAYSVDPSASDIGMVTAEYDFSGSGLRRGYTSTARFCNDARAYGNRAICGDGLVGTGEVCEIGETSSDECDSDGDGVADGTGTITITCETNCSGFQTAYEAETAGAECVPYECGNGVVEDTEECDDGSLNGSYGYCGDDCTVDSGFSCGDGYLAGGEECDCGETDNFDDLTDTTDADFTGDSWAYLNGCFVSNGQYHVEPSVTCAGDCTAPGPSCGDAEVNGGEECDGDYETWDGALCYGGSDDGEPCSTDDDCDSGACGGATGYEACGQSRVCDEASSDTDGDGTVEDYQSFPCDADADCGDGTCGAFTYELTRSRTCSTTSGSKCTWEAWNTVGGESCLGGEETCGNGEVEGDEECDDGNDENTDACTNSCELNVCGDDYVYSGVESCDDGSDNGDECDASYESVCYYCTTTCQYRSRSGAYCGDGEANGTEFCDGSDVSYYCFDFTDLTDRTRGSSCDPDYYGDEGSSAGCESGEVCRYVGICNGGDYNGELCTINPETGATQSSDSSADTGGCGSDGTCVAPTCADDCSAMCPHNFESGSVLIQTEEAGSSAEESATIYNYLSGFTPDNAALYLPACSVATALTADLEIDMTPPSLDVVFVTDLSGSMEQSPSGRSAASPDRRIDIVAEATENAVMNIFDAYSGTGVSAKIGLVSFTTNHTEASGSTVCGIDAATRDGANEDVHLTTTVPALTAQIQTYPSCTGGGTPTYAGLDVAYDMLTASTSTGEVKVIVLLTDGDPSYNNALDVCDASDTSDTTDVDYSIGGFTGTEACVYQAGALVNTITDDGIIVYAAAITSSDTLRAYTEHFSSDTCDFDSMSSLDDCEPTENVEYAYSADTADEIEDMYDEIVDLITSVRFSLTTETDGTTTTTTGTVDDGRNQTLPFPDGFECTGEDMVIPVVAEFDGEGTVTLSDISFTYCPAQ